MKATIMSRELMAGENSAAVARLETAFTVKLMVLEIVPFGILFQALGMKSSMNAICDHRGAIFRYLQVSFFPPFHHFLSSI
jgi:hypothetical protein